ncbi:thioesterase domain-containing protein [Aliarcobacter butzleri]|uniref:Thioesterase domain-containing protein n=1 Tax=Aliarcobacter butzleri TaxID=28197 RepID=A0AAW7Q6K4_9BACT|nr:thioesterase domain-containing protein [Aliarcobacter butzleri]MCG3660165.1 thioesterase domain-containing protein [Aliarcobacter butzleri]MCG3663147.1 thioesterase domain-containing protein [Aliarcobacter butzleri]MCG3672469.1 thioesterase domain-containing protein [Aliarcobacter butzleri]MCG3682786.1 thioesterase domain-containing protein [Aliarcobacter butzleri]MCG3690255.1 thioesterase domain-containing protein [Aliarcobacter butzleri]
MIKILENKLHNEIPLTKFMDLKITKYDEKELITIAPLNKNINDKGTAFGGSLATLTIISGWSICWLISKELEINSENIVVIKNEHSYRKPVTKELICHTKRPTKDEIENLKNKLLLKKSASIKISSQIIEDDEVCVDFTGYYVIKI